MAFPSHNLINVAIRESGELCHHCPGVRPGGIAVGTVGPGRDVLDAYLVEQGQAVGIVDKTPRHAGDTRSREVPGSAGPSPGCPPIPDRPAGGRTGRRACPGRRCVGPRRPRRPARCRWSPAAAPRRPTRPTERRRTIPARPCPARMPPRRPGCRPDPRRASGGLPDLVGRLD